LQLRDLLDRHDMVGMHHVELVAEAIDPAADRPPFADRQVLQEPVIAGIEENEIDEPGPVTAAHPIGCPWIDWLLMPLDLQPQGDDCAILSQSEAGARPPVDDAARPMPQEIDHMRPAQLLRELREPWPQARQPVEAGKKREENGGTHVCPDRPVAADGEWMA